MYHELKLDERVKVSPSDLNCIEQVIRKYVMSKINKCDKKYGYIMNVKSITIDLNHIPIIRHTGECLVNIEYVIEALLPTIGDVYEDTVITHLLPDAIFVLYKTVQIIIPYNGTTSTFSKGQKINVKIVDVRYAKKRYQCIGEVFICTQQSV